MPLSDRGQQGHLAREERLLAPKCRGGCQCEEEETFDGRALQGRRACFCGKAEYHLEAARLRSFTAGSLFSGVSSVPSASGDPIPPEGRALSTSPPHRSAVSFIFKWVIPSLLSLLLVFTKLQNLALYCRVYGESTALARSSIASCQ